MTAFHVADGSIERTVSVRSDSEQDNLCGDISSVDAHAKLIEDICGQLGPIHCLVNNAGVTSMVRGDLLDVTVESFDRCVGTNLRGTFFLTQAVARSMLTADASGNQSLYRSIVTITSVNAEVLGLNRADYCITKAALSMASKLFAAKLASSRIHVFELRPGIIRTDMTAPAQEKYDRYIDEGGIPLGHWGDPAMSQSVWPRSLAACFRLQRARC